MRLINNADAGSGDQHAVRPTHRNHSRLHSTASTGISAIAFGVAFLGAPNLAWAADQTFNDATQFETQLAAILALTGDNSLTYNGVSPTDIVFNGAAAAPGSSSSLLIDLGQALTIGTTANSSLTIGAGTTLDLGAKGHSFLRLGSVGQTGSLYVQGGEVNVGSPADSNSIYVGATGGPGGTLSITNGGVVNIGIGSTQYSRLQSYGTSTIVLDDGHILFGAEGHSVRLGQGGKTTFTMTNGSTIGSLGAGGHFVLGEGVGGEVEATVDNSSIIISGSNLPEGYFAIGRGGGIGAFTQTGPDSEVRVFGMTHIAVGLGNGIGTYVLKDGLLEVGTDLSKDAFGIGMAYGDSNATSKGTFNVEGGTALLHGDLIIAGATSTTGEVNISGGLVSVGEKVKFGRGTGAMNLNGGVLELGGANAITGTGAIKFDGGTIRASSNLSIAHAAVLNNAGAIFDSNGKQITYNGLLSGSGDLTKVGSGELVLTGSSGNAFTGDVMVSEGTLTANGDHRFSDYFVGAGGRLRGTGIGDVFAMSGSPGGIVGSGEVGVTVNTGNIDFAGGLVYEVVVNDAGNSSFVGSDGTVVLDGGTLRVVAQAGDYAEPERYHVLLAGVEVSGQFSTIEDNLAFFDFAADYSVPKSVYLDLVALAMADIAETANQAAVADAIESAGPGTPIFDAIFPLDEASAVAALEALSGEIHASAQTVLIEDGRHLRDAAYDRLRVGLADSENESGTNLWGTAFGALGSIESDGNAAGLDHSAAGVFAGSDGTLNGWTLGALAGYSRSSFESGASSGSADSFHVGLYGGTRADALAIRGGLAYSSSEVGTERSVVFPGLSEDLAASYAAGTFQAFGEFGYTIEMENASFEPFVNLAHVRVNTDGFSETGGDAALTAAASAIDATFATLGVRASADLQMSELSVTAHGMIGWRHAVGDNVPTTTLAFADGDDFTVAGLPAATDAAVVEAGLDFGFAEGATLGLSYGGQFAEGNDQHSGRLNLSVQF